MAEGTAPDNGTSEAGAPGEGAGQGFDYQQGYNQLRPEFTRATQDLAESRERLSDYEQLFQALHDDDESIRLQAMEALGLDAPAGPQGTGTDDDEFVDPLEKTVTELRSEVEELRSAREQEAQEREQAQLIELRDEFIGEAVSFIEEEQRKSNAAFKFTQAEETTLGNLAIAMVDKDGMPDVQGAYNLLYGDEGFLETNRQRWVDTKSGAAQAPGGRTVPTAQRPTNAKERIAFVDERMRALEDQR